MAYKKPAPKKAVKATSAMMKKMPMAAKKKAC
jgi:hypothetical protein